MKGKSLKINIVFGFEIMKPGEMVLGTICKSRVVWCSSSVATHDAFHEW